jgi:hypothetical protein
MHTPSLKFEEDMQFPKVIIVKQFLEKLLSLKSGLYSSVWIFKTNTFRAQEFVQIYTLFVHGISDLLQFRHNWNQEIISEFYFTLFYDKKERIFIWMTNGRRFHVKLAQFAQILGLFSQLDISKKLHSRRVMMPREMTPMYI